MGSLEGVSQPASRRARSFGEAAGGIELYEAETTANQGRGGVVTFDALDEPMSCDESSAPTDTQTLRYVRCEVCGIPVYGEPNSDEPLHGARCPVCDGRVIAATVDLLVKSCVPVPNKT